MENLDPMGVHTGDSIVVAPSQTLTDKEYQMLRSAALKIIRALGIEGGCNIQFGLAPRPDVVPWAWPDGEDAVPGDRLDLPPYYVIEVNPRVSRSSALASKATGFPIAKIAAKLAVGYTLDEIPNDITRETPACFEPTIDYVVVKVPRFTFEKFPQAKDLLTPQMKSVGEAMAIGRTFKESLQKAMRSLETGSYGFESKVNLAEQRAEGLQTVRGKLQHPNAQRLWYLGDAFRLGMESEEIYQLSGIDPWFLEKIREIIATETEIQSWNQRSAEISAELLRSWKQMGFADARLAALLNRTEAEIRYLRKAKGIEAVFCAVDTCGA
jgi:carbamoyl-phosphate synthase large subunit